MTAAAGAEAPALRRCAGSDGKLENLTPSMSHGLLRTG
jgi:hypothetical protein